MVKIDKANTAYVQDVRELLNEMKNEAVSIDLGSIAEAINVEDEYVDSYGRFSTMKDILQNIIDTKAVAISNRQLIELVKLYKRIKKRIGSIRLSIKRGELNKNKYPNVKYITIWEDWDIKFTDSKLFQELFLDEEEYRIISGLFRINPIGSFFKMIRTLIDDITYNNISSKAENEEEANLMYLKYLDDMYYYESLTRKAIKTQRLAIDDETVEIATETLKKVNSVIGDLNNLGRNLTENSCRYVRIRSIIKVADLKKE